MMQVYHVGDNVIPVDIDALPRRIHEHLRDAPDRHERIRAVWTGFVTALQENAMLPASTYDAACAEIGRIPRNDPAEAGTGRYDAALPHDVELAALAARARLPMQADDAEALRLRVVEALASDDGMHTRLFWTGFLLGLGEHSIMPSWMHRAFIELLAIDNSREAIELCYGDVGHVTNHPELWNPAYAEQAAVPGKP